MSTGPFYTKDTLVSKLGNDQEGNDDENFNGRWPYNEQRQKDGPSKDHGSNLLNLVPYTVQSSQKITISHLTGKGLTSSIKRNHNAKP